MSLLRQAFTYFRCNYQHFFLSMEKTHNLSHFQVTLSFTKAHYETPCMSSILLNKTYLFLLCYTLVHHPNFLTNHHDSITKATKAHGVTVQIFKYVRCTLHHAISNGTSSCIFTFSPILIIGILVNTTPSTPPMKGVVVVKRHFCNFHIQLWLQYHLSWGYNFHFTWTSHTTPES